MVWIIVASILGLYVLLSFGVYFLQEKLIFFPEELRSDYEFKFKERFEELTINTSSGSSLNALWFKVEKPKGIVLYMHGNAGSLERWGGAATHFVERGYDAFIYDYPGFGKSKGDISEKTLFDDAFFLYRYLRKHYSNTEIILYGRSLGSGIASQLASKVKPKVLVLETPYFSMRAMADKTIPYLPVSLLLKYPIRSDRFIKKVKCPIYIIHGTEDELIPHEQAVKLSKQRKGIDFLSIEGGKHNGLELFPPFDDKLDEILNVP